MAVVDTLIQSAVVSEHQPRLARGSDGTLYVVYIKNSTDLCIAYSTDAGLTWTQVDSGTDAHTTSSQLALAIDSQDIIHVIYNKTSDDRAHYKQFTINGGWTTEENPCGAFTTQVHTDLSIAVDSVDNVHITFWELGIMYNKRTSGTWGTPVYISATSNAHSPQMAIDSHNYIYVVYRVGDIRIYYVKYTSFWTSEIEIPQIAATSIASDAKPSLAIDSSDNVHVVWRNTSPNIVYVKYTFATDSWSAAAVVTSSASCVYPTIAVDSSDNLNVVYYAETTPTAVWFIQNTGTWGAATKLFDGPDNVAFQHPQIQSPIYPLISGTSTNIATIGYHFTYINTVSGVAILRYYASDGFSAPLVAENYSREENSSLPSTDTNLSTLFNALDYSNVADENFVFTDQTATNKYAIFEFKNRADYSGDPINVTWTGRSSLAPLDSTVYLQIYNQNSGSWETLDSDSTSSADTNFTLTGSQGSNLSDYYSSNWVSCRVYQHVNVHLETASDTITVTTTPTISIA